MNRPTHHDLRERFLRYFESHAHRRISSASLVPQSDPTLLFTNAGMVPFKPFFTGEQKPPTPRAASSQKCVRAGGKHNDLENVGYTARHHTFFEMLGNFSFGDYFKDEAIRLAWTFVTADIGLPIDRLVVTVFKGEDGIPADDEAAALWEAVGVPPERIVRLGMADNFWSMGDTGPCGPCSEIHYYQGDLDPQTAIGIFDTPAADDQWIEIWNLVFMQFERFADASMQALPKPSIDTGMGLERLCAVVQGVRSNYDTDLFAPILARIGELFGLSYADVRGDERGTAMRVVADHARAAAFLIADGVLPSNEGRGYVLRRIMRRAIRYGRKLGDAGGPFLARACAAVVEEFGGVYPELREQAPVIARVVDLEEERFGATLEHGLKLFADEVATLRKAGGTILDGESVFRLYDTFGFPVDLTALLAREQGLAVDEVGFEAAMEAQRQRARRDGGFKKAAADLLAALPARPQPTLFTGNDALTGTARVLALLSGGQPVDVAEAPAELDVILDRSPAYAEGGGQVGDTGWLIAPTARARLLDVQKQDGIFLHRVRLEGGTLSRDEELRVEVDAVRRTAIVAHHTGTHMLQAALRDVLGTHVRQAGSRVDDEQLRFDFAHFAAMAPEERRAVEDRINTEIRANRPVETAEMAYDDAITAGALAFFGDKYGDRVRVVDIKGFSVELCGGTHVSSTGQIGLWLMEAESGVAAGTRRIEAVAADRALARVRGFESDLDAAATRLQTPRRGLLTRLDQLVESADAMDRELTSLKSRLAGEAAKDLAAAVEAIGPWRVLATQAGGAGIDDLRRTADRLREQMPDVVLLLASIEGDQPSLFCVVPDALQKDLHAGKLLQAAAVAMGGRGGGRPANAQGGGGDPAKVADGLNAFREAVAMAARV